jgi:putative transposase
MWGAGHRQGANRALLRASLDQVAIDNIRLALNQNQPLGTSRFMTKIARMTGERRDA